MVGLVSNILKEKLSKGSLLVNESLVSFILLPYYKRRLILYWRLLFLYTWKEWAGHCKEALRFHDHNWCTHRQTLHPVKHVSHLPKFDYDGKKGIFKCYGLKRGRIWPRNRKCASRFLHHASRHYTHPYTCWITSSAPVTDTCLRAIIGTHT